MKCNVCGEGTLKPSRRDRQIEYVGSVGAVSLHFSVCDVCCSEITDEEQSVLNRRAVNRFKKLADGVPLGAQIRAMRKVSNLTQAEAGTLLGGGPVAFSKYENDDLLPDAGMTTLLRLLISDPSLVDRIRAQRSETSIATKKTFGDSMPCQSSSTWTSLEASDDDNLDVVSMIAVETREPFVQTELNPLRAH